MDFLSGNTWIKCLLGMRRRNFFVQSALSRGVLSPKAEAAIEDNPTYFEKTEEEEIELINLETNQRLVVRGGVSRIINRHDTSGGIESVYPRFLHVEKRPFGSERYADIVDSLKQLCQASIETGNPIILDVKRNSAAEHGVL